MPHVLGLDGGQTATTAALCDLSGRLLGLGRAGPANHVWEPGGVERAERAIGGALSEAAQQAGLNAPRFRAAFLGLTGCNDQTRAVIRKLIPADLLAIEHDQVTALACVTRGKPGVVVIAGTGTIAYGQSARGESASCSGWGYLFGDEGAGFWIAKQALAAASRAYDGRGEPTLLVDKLTAAAGAEGLWSLHDLIYSGEMDRAAMAALARVLPVACEEGDAVARRILREAGRELGISAGTIVRQLGFQEEAVPVGMIGGVAKAGAWVLRPFRREVRRHAPRAVFVQPELAPVMGSVLLALKMAEVEISEEMFANLKAASEVVGAK